MLPEKKLSILIGCYGDYPQYSIRAVESVLSGYSDPNRPFSLHVGLNSCGTRTIKRLRTLYSKGRIDSLIESKQNINKCPMKRLLIDRCDTEFALWMDDDSHVSQGWLEELMHFINSNPTFDVAGLIHRKPRDISYQTFLRNRPWYRGEEYWSELTAEASIFATGGCYLFRVSYLRQHHYPDKAMIKASDDMLLGDLVAQQSGNLVPFSPSLLSCLAISDGERRGAGETRQDFLLVDPFTGAYSKELVYRSEDPLPILKEAKELEDSGELEEALKFYNKLIELRPDFPELHYQCGSILHRLGRCKDAVCSFEKAINLKEAYPEAFNGKGQALLQLNLVDQACDAFKEAIHLDESFLAAHNNLGNALLAAGKNSQALEALKYAQRLSPKQPEIHYNLATAYYRMGDLNRALLHARLAVHYKPEYAEAHFLLGLLWLKAGELEEGSQEIEWRFKIRNWPQSRFLIPVQSIRDQDSELTVYQEGTDTEALYFLNFLVPLLIEEREIRLVCTPTLAPVAKLLPNLTVIIEKNPAESFLEALPLFSILSLPNVKNYCMNYLQTGSDEFSHGLNSLRVGSGRVLITWDCFTPYPGFESAVDFERIRELFEQNNIDQKLVLVTSRDEFSFNAAGFKHDNIVRVPFNNFEAVCRALHSADVVVTFESSTALLAGLLSKDCIFISKEASAWFWSDSASSFRLFPRVQVLNYASELNEENPPWRESLRELSLSGVAPAKLGPTGTIGQ